MQGSATHCPGVGENPPARARIAATVPARGRRRQGRRHEALPVCRRRATPPAGDGGARRADASAVLAAFARPATALAPAGSAAATAVRPSSAVRSPASGAGAIDAAGATAIEPPVTAVVRTGRRRPDIPGFRLLGVLGEGGMGTVYAGEQDAPRRPVAIKVLHATSTAALTRFFAEAEIMARLDHPGIAKVLEAGEADGHPYFVMERVEGVTLDAHVRAHALATPARLRLFAALCDAIHHAHVKGVIHRDLKPSNVMVRDDGRIAVLDFGIARVADGAGSSSGETRAGDLIGTPLYMSPEQARLRPDEVDARSDVYTLGVILYELVSDELPYDVRGRSLPDVARAICEAPPRPLGRHRAAWRGDLEAICDKALAKEPERRYASAAALGDDVRRHLEGATISARAPGLLEQVRRFARRRPGVTAAAAAAVVAGALFAVVVTLLWLEARDARRVAERERARVAAARDQLEERTNLLVLDQARAALATDPTAALAALATLGERGVDAAAAWAIADEAWGLGAAHAVLRGHGDEARWVEPVAGADRVVSAGYDGRALRWDGGAASAGAGALQVASPTIVARPAAPTDARSAWWALAPACCSWSPPTASDGGGAGAGAGRRRPAEAWTADRAPSAGRRRRSRTAPPLPRDGARRRRARRADRRDRVALALQTATARPARRRRVSAPRGVSCGRTARAAAGALVATRHAAGSCRLAELGDRRAVMPSTRPGRSTAGRSDGGACDGAADRDRIRRDGSPSFSADGGWRRWRPPPAARSWSRRDRAALVSVADRSAARAQNGDHRARRRLDASGAGAARSLWDRL
ncbi:MAG: serine/threonine protein kinase [Kofleriaceae bacterium]|nr:serine/threonine protein kinase [Kofleriaceae bacterium]